MNIITYQGEIIAAIINKEDAEHFYKWKCERLLFEQNEKMIDQIAEENGLDRRYPGLFPLSVTERYYDAARKQISQDCKLLEKALTITEQKAPKPRVERQPQTEPKGPKL